MYDHLALQNRRRFLLAAGFMPTLALPAAAAPSSTVAELAAGLAHLSTLAAAYSDACDDLWDAQQIYDQGRPLRPKALRWHYRLGMICDHATFIEPDGKKWSFVTDASIEEMRMSPRFSTGLVIVDGDRVLIHSDHHEERPLTEPGRRRWVEQDAKCQTTANTIVKAYDAWKAQCRAYADEVGLTAAAAATDRADDRYHSELTRLLAIPVTTLAGFALKAVLVRDYDDEAGEALVNELAALAGDVTRGGVNV